jgi:translation initiation factor IF-2
MLSIKLHEATREFKISNKLAMFFLEKRNVPVKSHSSVISMEQLELLREFSGHKEKYSPILEEFNRIEREKRKQAKTAKKDDTAVKEVVKEVVKEKKQKTKEAPGEAVKEKQPQPQVPAKEPERPRPQKFRPAPEGESEVAREPEHRVITEPVEPVEKVIPPVSREVESPTVIEPVEMPPPQPPPPPKPQAPQPHRPSHPTPPPQRFKKKEKNRATGNERRKDDRTKPGQQKRKPVEVEKKKEKEKAKPKVYNLPEMIQTSDFINVKELAEKLNVKLKDIEEKTRLLKKEYLPSQFLEGEEIKEICAAFGVEVDIVSYEGEIFSRHIEDFKAKLSPRAPVVTVMGHVDHGKTTLLDTLRHTRVADKEAGGITQRIGAYKLTFNNNDIIFIDTPGHEAFTNIRARGAQVTDVVVLVVAANDGVQPQTIEAINHARAAGVPILVAINKIDLDGANPNKVKEQLTRYEITVEDWGGDVVSVEISAKQNKNLDTLLEMIALLAEMSELKAYKDIPARGTIIEARLDPKLGPLGTVLLQHGKLKRGDFFICGNAVGKVKAIFDEHSEVLPQAVAPVPVEVMGFDNVPEAGELFQVTDDIEKAKKVVDLRKQQDKENRKDESFTEKKLSLQNLFQKLEENKTKVISMILKTDNFSSGEVLERILSKQSQEQLKVNVLHQGIGNVTESDVLLASTSGASVIGFNVKTPQNVMALAKRENVEIKLYNVIYHLIEDVEKIVKGEIKPEFIETLVGKVEVLQVFKISKIGVIAGCLVKEGKVTAKSKIKVIRKNDLVFEGEIETLRRVKNEASEVAAGTECGIRIKNFNAVEIGDMLEIYELKLK